MNSEISSSELLQRLFKTSNIKHFVKLLDKKHEVIPFSAYIGRLCKERNILPAQVIKRSGIERTFGHQLFNGRRIPSRDKVIQIAFGFGLDYEQTQKLLKASQKSPLYPKIGRDAVVIYALKHGFGIIETQATLHDLSPPSGQGGAQI